MNVPCRVLKFARAQGYDGAEYYKDWKEYRAYRPLFLEDGKEIPLQVGLPLFILQKDCKCRMTDSDECFEVMGK